MKKNEVLCRVLSIQKRKKTVFLYVSGFNLKNQLLIDIDLFRQYNIGVMTVIKGQCIKEKNHKKDEVYRLIKIDSVVTSAYDKAHHAAFTNKALSYRLCKNQIMNEIRNYLDSIGFQSINSPFTIPYRGTSIASPLKIQGKYVDRYCKITHEFSIKKEMAENLIPVYELGYVARDIYTTTANWFEYSILELVTPKHGIDFVEKFINKFIETACSVSDDFGLDHFDFSNNKRIVLDDNGCFEGVSYDVLKNTEKNAMFLNAPVQSPLVKLVDGRRSETIWMFEGESMAHGYQDENDWHALVDYCNFQMEELKNKGINGEFSADFISLMQIGVPNSVSIGFGVDRFFQFFWAFKNMNEYRKIACHSGEY